MTKRTGRFLLLFSLPFCSLACQSNTPQPATHPVANAVAGQKKFEYPQAGISFSYPADWKPVTGSKSQLKVEAPNGGQLTLDVPTLPIHFGILPLDKVTSGYEDNVRKKIPDATVTNLPDPTVPDSKQHLVKLSGHLNGKPAINEAALLVHDDKVYILSIDTDDKGYGVMHGVLDSALKSLQWK
jgi:hypothetical protein